MADISCILARIDSGDPAAADQLLPLVYDELRKLAAARLAHEKPGQTLQATALVHEAYLRLVGPAGPAGPESPSDVELAARSRPAGGTYDSRGHFFAAAAEAMRRILVERARRKQAQKHGGGLDQEPLENLEIAAPVPPDEVLAVHEALDLLDERDPVAARLVKLRYFSGLTNREAAEVLDLPPRTADRIWVYARTWLYREIKRSLSSELLPRV
jgi:RNA polymerase sigma factor (sigma-70 family)